MSWVCLVSVLPISRVRYTFILYTVLILMEARRASVGISPSETVLISKESNYCYRNTTYPLYITRFHCYMTY